MATQYFSVPVGDGAPGDASQAVMVPLNRKPLGPMPRERIRRIREHLVRSLRDLRRMKRPDRDASPLRPEPDGFAGSVARAACSQCKGWCCKGGGDHAYLDERTMARVRRDNPELDARAVIGLYVRSVPQESYQGSCVFHGAQGCMLDRGLRSDLCNTYFCSGLERFLMHAAEANSAVVIAGDGDAMRLSPVLTRQPEPEASDAEQCAEG